MSAFKPVLLGSDFFLWLLVLVVTVAFVVSCRNPISRRAWRQIGTRPAAMAALVFLSVFLLIGLADSLHYQLRMPDIAAETETAEQATVKQAIYSVEVFSVLDWALTHLRTRNEKTYSEPLAIDSYAKEAMTVMAPDGSYRQIRDFPRLRFGGAHLGEHTERWRADIVERLRQAGVATLAVLFPLLLLLTALAAWCERSGWTTAVVRIITGRTAFAWRTLMLALAVVTLIICVLFLLAIDYHPLGTDKVGEDILYQVLKSVRTALVIGLVTTVVLLPLAVSLGILAGYFGGWIDDLIQYIYTTINSIPSVLLIAAAVLMMQVIIDVHPHWFVTAMERADWRLLALCAILGMTSWTGLARLLRGETMKLRELEYIQAARAFGVSHFRILIRHIMPNVMHIIIIALVMDFSSLVLAEAVLSYIGIGVDPMTHSFGLMINNARMELSREPAVWWALAASFVLMFTLVLSANVLADAVRDAFDPRVKV